MDTTWFAIDRDGHVAVFDSGESGAVPADAYLGDDHPAVEAQVTAASAGAPDRAADDEDDEQRVARLVAAGAYVYSHGEGENWIAGPYERLGAPPTPLAADRLPTEVRARMARFPGRFAEQEALQPAEHWQVEAWGPTWLASDGKTVRCVPGREADYAEEVANLDPEGLTIEPARPARPARPWWKFWGR